jgi:broad specificity phosphatase PhoE
LLLVRHAPTAATRAAAFPLDEPLDDDGRAAAASLAGALPGDAAGSAALLVAVFRPPRRWGFDPRSMRDSASATSVGGPAGR